VIDRMVSDARVLMSEGVGFAAICSNDVTGYPEDSFENMKRFAKAHNFPFPYLHDGPRQSLERMEPSARPTSSATIAAGGSSIAAG
jgi:hypothetical protein